MLSIGSDGGDGGNDTNVENCSRLKNTLYCALSLLSLSV